MKFWIARDKNNTPCIYTDCPVRKDSYFTNNKDYVYLPQEWFPEITWENSPKQVELRIID